MARSLAELASEALKERGWIQGSIVDPWNDDGAVCALGAMNMAATGNPFQEDGGRRKKEFRIVVKAFAELITQEDFVEMALKDWGTDYERWTENQRLDAVYWVCTDIIGTWNDEPGRVVEEVDAMFVLLREKEAVKVPVAA